MERLSFIRNHKVEFIIIYLKLAFFSLSSRSSLQHKFTEVQFNMFILQTNICENQNWNLFISPSLNHHTWIVFTRRFQILMKRVKAAFLTVVWSDNTRQWKSPDSKFLNSEWLKINFCSSLKCSAQSYLFLLLFSFHLHFVISTLTFGISGLGIMATYYTLDIYSVMFFEDPTGWFNRAGCS